MKKRAFALLILLTALLCAEAQAQTLPSNALFSPGLVKLAELETANPYVTAEAVVDIDEAAYARDLSLLGSMLEGMTIAYAGRDGGTLSFTRNDELLGVYAVPQSGAPDALAQRLAGTPILERVPLASIAQWLEGLAAGDALAFGYAVETPFELKRTMSDDGTRLTKITLTGSVARAGETPWQVEGFMYQPAGRAPKDSFELTFTQDADNYVELLYSALRENVITRKNKAGETSVRTTLKAAGRDQGYGFSGRLTVTMKNQWTADGEALKENIAFTTSLSLQDRKPDSRMRRLNDASALLKHTIRLETHEAGNDTIALRGDVKASVTMDGNALLSAAADVRVNVGGEPAEPDGPAAQITEETAKELARKIYLQLGDAERKKIHYGL